MSTEPLLITRMSDEDWRAGERVRCNGCTRHVRTATRVATLDLGEEVFLCSGCLAKAVTNALETIA